MINEYNKENWPISQEVMDGIVINPKLPEHFFNLDHHLRSSLEVEHWFERPFVLLNENSNKYDVYCLTDGVSSHPSWFGEFRTANEAIEYIKSLDVMPDLRDRVNLMQRQKAHANYLLKTLV
jgi:hypothetical protein